MNENITSKVRKTIRRYLELRSYEVLEDGREACARSSTETETCLASVSGLPDYHATHHATAADHADAASAVACTIRTVDSLS